MTEYLRLRTWAEVSENSDYHSPAGTGTFEYTATPTGYDPARKVTALAAGSTFDLGHYSAVSVVVIENTDATNFVEVTHYYDSAVAKTYLPAGAHTIIYNPTVGNDLLLAADTADAVCKVWVAGTAAVT